MKQLKQRKMNSLKHITATIALVLLFGFTASAQKNFVKDADKAFENKQYYSAVELYKKSIPKLKKKQDKARATYMIAECYRLISDFKQAEAWYDKAIRANTPEPKAHLYLAEARKVNGKYDEAIVEYQKYKELVPSAPEGENGVKSSELAQKWKDNPTRHKVENMAQINTKELDFSPVFGDKKNSSLIFVSKREGNAGGSSRDDKTGMLFSDLFETKVDKNGKWSAPSPLVGPVNGPANEGPLSINKKADKIFFTRCGQTKKKIVKCQIYMATKKGSSWSEPELMTFGLDSAENFNFRHPALSPDETVLVFQSDMEDAPGDTEVNNDLFISTYDKKNKTWSKPVNLGAPVNTQENEAWPYIHENGSLYFSSTGHLGMGGYDIFKAERKAAGKWEWSTPENLKYPMNSNGDDFGIVFDRSRDKTTERGYLTSNREGTKGGDDIWQFVLPPLVFDVAGSIKDCKTGANLEGAVVRMTGSDGSSVEEKTDKDGKYKFKLAPNTSYVITVIPEGVKYDTKKLRGYFGLKDEKKGKITTVGEDASKSFTWEGGCLDPIPMEDIRFPDVLYDLGKATLRPESKDSLNYLYQVLVDNPTLVIELSSHTDSRGSNAANKILSENRAKSCYDYLVNEKKINPARIKPKGYGEEKLLVKDKDIAKLKTKEEQEAAHQRNRRTVFRVLRTDFVDPNAPKIDRKIVIPNIIEKDDVDYEDEEGTEGEGGTGTGTGTGTESKSSDPKTGTTQPATSDPKVDPKKPK